MLSVELCWLEAKVCKQTFRQQAEHHNNDGSVQDDIDDQLVNSGEDVLDLHSGTLNSTCVRRRIYCELRIKLLLAIYDEWFDFRNKHDKS